MSSQVFASVDPASQLPASYTSPSLGPSIVRMGNDAGGKPAKPPVSVGRKCSFPRLRNAEALWFMGKKLYLILHYLGDFIRDTSISILVLMLTLASLRAIHFLQKYSFTCPFPLQHPVRSTFVCVLWLSRDDRYTFRWAGENQVDRRRFASQPRLGSMALDKVLNHCERPYLHL